MTRTEMSRKLSAEPFWFWVAFLILVGVIGRYAMYISVFGVPDADESVGGVMGMHNLHGEFVSAFYWGQAYGGPLEVWLAAPLVAAFGQSYLVLRSVPIILSALSALAVWRVGRRLLSPIGAVTAGALSWSFPLFLYWKTIHFHIFYASGTLLGVLTLLQALRVKEEPSNRRIFILGLINGLALWQSLQLVTIVPVTLIWLALQRREALRRLPAFVLGTVPGLLPILLSNLRHDWWTTNIGGPGNEVPYLTRLWQFFTRALPMALDLRTPVTLHWVIWRPGAFLLYLLALGTLVGLVIRRPAWRIRSDTGLLIALAMSFPFIYALSPLTSVPETPVYVIVFMPIVSLLLGALTHDGKQAVLLTGAALILVIGSAVDLHRSYHPGSRLAFDTLGVRQPLPRSFRPLIDRLDQLHIRRAYAGYWVAYRLDFETGERIIAAEIRPAALRTRPDGTVIPLPDDPYLNARHPQYEAIVGKVLAPAFIFVKGFDPPSTDYGQLEDARYLTSQIGPFTIYYKGRESAGTG